MTLDLPILDRLAREEGYPRATVCWTLGAPGDPMDKTRIALKNAQDALDAALEEADLGDDAAEAMREAFREWAESNVGDARGAVAAFLTPDSARIETLPAIRREGAWIGDVFRIAPVWPDPGDRFDAAALVADSESARLVRLHDGALERMKSELPESLEDFLGPKEIQPDTGARGRGPSDRNHATGETPEQEKEEEFERYAGALARAATEALHNTDLPLVIVADEKLHGHIRANCDYHRLVDDGITRHPQSMSEAELAQSVGEVAQAEAEAARNEDLERLEAALGRGDPASADAAEVAAAAHQGRIELLLFDPGMIAPGRIDAEGLAEKDSDGPHDLVEAAVRGALRSSSQLRAVSDRTRPLAAVMRW